LDLLFFISVELIMTEYIWNCRYWYVKQTSVEVLKSFQHKQGYIVPNKRIFIVANYPIFHSCKY